MGIDGALRTSLLLLAAAMCVVGLATFSFKKMMATYALGLFAIAGLVLPDWEFFDREFSQWLSPVTIDRAAAGPDSGRAPPRFRFYPLRIVLFTTIYSFALYKWWMYIIS